MSSNTGYFRGASGRADTFTGNEDPFYSENSQASQSFHPRVITSGSATSNGGLQTNNRDFVPTAPRTENGLSIATSLNPATESWVPSAHQALTNALQVSVQSLYVALL